MDQRYHREQEGESRNTRAPPTTTEKVYMGIALAQAIIEVAIVFTVFGLAVANVPVPVGKAKTVPVYLAIFIMGQLFCVLYIWDALRHRNVVQLFLQLWFQLSILTYAILQIPQSYNALDELDDERCGAFARCEGPGSLFNVLRSLLIVTPIIMGLAGIAFIFLARRIYIQFGWAEFHLVSASPEMRLYSPPNIRPAQDPWMHRQYQTFVSLLKMQLFFSTAFCLAFLVLVAIGTSQTTELVLASVALPLNIVVVILAAFVVRREIKWLMGLVLVLMLVCLAYFIYKLASMFLPATGFLYINTKITMALFSAFAIIMLVVTLVFGFICISNFDKGLAVALQKKTSALPEKVQAQEQRMDLLETPPSDSGPQIA
ncbi:hypothetical protein EHS25_002408 [Saitozyma podzolica]|uniref:TRP C-terminal domain-containing protein n=1 Tax=Saitozyma podzolica TaxID=1890683 RepID=A0A427YDY0_9TREE|nr:hypothetical protein EHS25_002408 [Saitozyma podzolica]